GAQIVPGPAVESAVTHARNEVGDEIVAEIIALVSRAPEVARQRVHGEPNAVSQPTCEHSPIPARRVEHEHTMIHYDFKAEDVGVEVSGLGHVGRGKVSDDALDDHCSDVTVIRSPRRRGRAAWAAHHVECLGGLQVDNELERGWLHYR